MRRSQTLVALLASIRYRLRSSSRIAFSGKPAFVHLPASQLQPLPISNSPIPMFHPITVKIIVARLHALS